MLVSRVPALLLQLFFKTFLLENTTVTIEVAQSPCLFFVSHTWHLGAQGTGFGLLIWEPRADTTLSQSTALKEELPPWAKFFRTGADQPTGLLIQEG